MVPGTIILALHPKWGCPPAKCVLSLNNTQHCPSGVQRKCQFTRGGCLASTSTDCAAANAGQLLTSSPPGGATASA